MVGRGKKKLTHDEILKELVADNLYEVSDISVCPLSDYSESDSSDDDNDIQNFRGTWRSKQKNLP